MGVTTTLINKPFSPRGNDQSPLAFNRAKLYSGKALDFDGVNDSVTISDNAAVDFGTSDFSIAFIMESSAAGNARILDKRNTSSGYTLYINSAKKLILELNDTTGNTGFATSTIYADGKLKHVVISADRDGNASFYINGALDESIDISSKSGNLDSTSDLFIGADAPSGSSLYYNGSIAGFKIFNTALTAAQVADLYNNPEKVVPTGVDNTALKLWLPMQEGAGTTAYDGSGNGNHGTISGATYVHGIGAPVAQTSVIDWNKGTNLKSHSEDISNGYTLQNLTLLQDNTTSPNGLDNADKIVETTTATKVFYSEQTSQSAGKYTTSLFVKSAERGFAFAQIGVDGATNRYGVVFDLSDGSFGSSNSVGTPTGTSYDISDAGNGWYRISVTATHTSGSVYGIFGPSNSATPTFNVSGYPSYAGDITKGLFVWGYQIEKADSVGPYIPTISAQTSEVLLPQGLTSGRDITGVNLFENVRKQGALNLDGNSWAEVHDNASLDITDAITLEAWVYWDLNGKSAGGIMSKWFPSNWGFLFFTNADTLTFYISNVYPATASVSHTFTANGWYHLVGTDDGTTIRLYIDGVQVGTTSSLGSIVDTGRELEIGRYNDSVSNTYGDSIAQPRIYNRALTAEEVQRNYNAGKNTYTN